MIHTVTIGKGVNTTRAIDWDALPESSKTFIIQYGLTQKLNDAHASVEKGKTAEIELAVDEMIDRLLDGSLEIRASSGRTSDPVRKRALQMAFDYLAKDKMKAKPRADKAKALVDASPRWLEMAADAIERDAAMMAQASEDELAGLVPEPEAQAA